MQHARTLGLRADTEKTGPGTFFDAAAATYVRRHRRVHQPSSHPAPGEGRDS